MNLFLFFWLTCLCSVAFLMRTMKRDSYVERLTHPWTSNEPLSGMTIAKKHKKGGETERGGHWNESRQHSLGITPECHIYMKKKKCSILYLKKESRLVFLSFIHSYIHHCIMLQSLCWCASLYSIEYRIIIIILRQSNSTFYSNKTAMWFSQDWISYYMYECCCNEFSQNERHVDKRVRVE